LAVGAQYRKEKLTNNSANPNLDVPGLSTAQAYGSRSVKAAYFELDAPVLESLDIGLSGRYDRYSTGIGKFSPKATAKFQPIRQFAVRGTYSKGFRAPTFAESAAAMSVTRTLSRSGRAASRWARLRNQCAGSA
jgi:iron complex outermembrane receptor protein